MTPHALEILEGINLYQNSQPMTFIVGLDRAVVDALVAKHYQDKGLDRRKREQFLDKIFQVEIQIPPSKAQMHGLLDAMSDQVEFKLTLDVSAKAESLVPDFAIAHLRERGYAVAAPNAITEKRSKLSWSGSARTK